MLVRNREANRKFKWYGTNPKRVFRAAGYAMDVRSFRTSEFKYFYVDKNLGTNYHVVGTLVQRFLRPANKKHLQPFIQRPNRIEIKKNERFFIPGAPGRKKKHFY